MAEEIEEIPGDYSEFVSDIQDEMSTIFKEHHIGPQSYFEHWEAFFSAIDWSEPFIQILIICHLILLFSVILSRNHLIPQITLFLFMSSCVVASEWVNEWSSYNYSQFSSQNYFDKRGVFCLFFFSGPLLGFL